MYQSPCKFHKDITGLSYSSSPLPFVWPYLYLLSLQVICIVHNFSSNILLNISKEIILEVTFCNVSCCICSIFLCRKRSRLHGGEAVRESHFQMTCLCLLLILISTTSIWIGDSRHQIKYTETEAISNSMGKCINSWVGKENCLPRLFYSIMRTFYIFLKWRL